MKEDRFAADVDRVRALLAILLAATHEPLRSLEKKMGLPSAGLSKILNGTVHLQLSHVLLITKAAGIDPGRFFRAVWPPDLRAASPVAEEFETALKAQGSLPAESPADEEFRQKVREALRGLLNL